MQAPGSEGNVRVRESAHRPAILRYGVVEERVDVVLVPPLDHQSVEATVVTLQEASLVRKVLQKDGEAGDLALLLGDQRVDLGEELAEGRPVEVQGWGSPNGPLSAVFGAVPQGYMKQRWRNKGTERMGERMGERENKSGGE